MVNQSLNNRQLWLVDILRVNGNERVAATGRDNLAPKSAQNLDEKVPAHRRMLVDNQPLPLQRRAIKKIRVALNVLFLGGSGLWGKFVMASLEQALFVKQRRGEGLGIKPIPDLPDY